MPVHARVPEPAKKPFTKNLINAIKAAPAILLVSLSMSVFTESKEKPSYQTGKLLDVAVQDVSRGTAIIGGMAAPIPGKLYVFQIQLDGLVYFAEYRAGKLSYKPDWVVNDPIDLRFGKENRMFLKREDGKELEVLIVKKVRQ
jgi:hypothetical protein